MRTLLWLGVAASVGGAFWWYCRRTTATTGVSLRLTGQGLHEGAVPISLAAAVQRARQAGGAIGLIVEAGAYEGDLTAIQNLFKREQIALVVKLPSTPLLSYTTAQETR